MWIGALIGGAAGIIGDAMSSSSAADTNQMNWQINQDNIAAARARQTQNEAFNANEAAIARQFSAQQVKQQEEYQTNSMSRAMDWNEAMSNTAMQRRMSDLRAAGINPLLAVSQGGASTPTISGMQGNAAAGYAASAGPAGQGSGIPMQNSGAAWGNLGATISNAIGVSQAQAQIDLIKAQTNKTNAEANQEIPAQVQYIKSMTGLTDANAQQVTQNINFLSKTFDDRTNITRAEMYSAQAKATEDDFKMKIAGQNLEVIRGTRDALISAAQSDAQAKKLGLAQQENLSDIAKSQLGKYISILNAILQPASTAAGIASKLP